MIPAGSGSLSMLRTRTKPPFVWKQAEDDQIASQEKLYCIDSLNLVKVRHQGTERGRMKERISYGSGCR